MLRQEPKIGDNVVVLAVDDVFGHGRGRIDFIRGEQGDREYGVKMIDVADGVQALGQFIRRETFMVLLRGVTLDSNAPLVRRAAYPLVRRID